MTDKKKKFKWTLNRIWTLPPAIFLAYFAALRQDSPAFETIGLLGGFTFLIWFLLNEGDWI